MEQVEQSGDELIQIFQGSDEWLAQRRGKFTASEIHKLMGQRGFGDTGMTYILEKVTEELGGTIPPVYSKAMEHGTLTEPFAKRHYELAFDCTILDQPFFIADWCDQAGASPDGIIEGKEEGIEVKCPLNPVNHIQYLTLTTPEEFKSEKKEYYWQVMFSMAVTGIKLWNFVSYHEDFTGKLRMSVLPVPANVADIALLKSRVLEAVKIKNEIIEKIKKRLA